MHSVTNQIIFTLLVLLISVLFFQYSGIDVALQNVLYDFQSNHWVVQKGHGLLHFVFVDCVKVLFIAFFIVLLTAVTFFRKTKIVADYYSGLLIVALSVVVIPILIGGLKSITNVPCPKNLELYGGTYPYVSVLSEYPAGFHQLKRARCYPAGHASGGFALMSLFFLFRQRKNKMIGLAVGLTAGSSIGLYKMMIGDHFLGHTVATMIISWLIILIIVSVIPPSDRHLASGRAV